MIVMTVVAMFTALSCSPGEGPESIVLPTSPVTTTTTTTTTIPATTTTTEPPLYEATVRRTTDGVAHINGASLDDVIYGQGWVSGEDYGCTLIDQIIKVTATRAATLGPGTEGENIESDFAWQAIGIADIATEDFENTASDDVVDAFEAFAAGWNDQLSDVGGTRSTGWCAESDWVRPITAVEAYIYARSIALQASSGRLTDYISSAQPPVPAPAGIRSSGALRSSSADEQLDLDAFASADLGLGGPADLGSNGWAIGSERVAGASGSLLLANPHFPWEGELRFHEVQLTVPGEFDIYGAQLVGVPGIGIGFTDGVAWTHTVSAGKRMTGYNLTLDPASNTSYLVDGVSEPMTSNDVTIEILRPDGTVDTETRTMYRSEYGPIIDFPGIGWTDSTVFTFRDANLDNDEFIEQYMRMPEIESIADLQALTEQYQGVPLFNTIASDAEGNVWYADTSATPHLSPEAEQAFRDRLGSDLLTQIAWDQGFALLDGSNSLFRWLDEPGARDPGLVPYTEMPMVDRTDYVFNANDSYWVPSAEFTIDGTYSILHGEQGIAQSMRTRQNAAVLGAANTAGLAGDDGLFTADEVRTAAFQNGAQTATLLRAAVVEACTARPLVDVAAVVDDAGTVILPAGQVDVSAACSVLAEWDGIYDLDRAGPLIWHETMTRIDPAAFDGAGALFADPFDPANPTTTPAVPNPDPTAMLQALAHAVQTIGEAGFAVDTTLGAAQFTERSGTRIPIHGGTGLDGVTNVVSWTGPSSSSEPVPERGEAVLPGTDLRGEGYRVNFGTSFVMTVDFTGDDVAAWALLVYGETGDRTSPLFDSQMVKFSEKQWRQVVFTDEQIEADPDLDTYTVVGR